MVYLDRPSGLNEFFSKHAWSYTKSEGHARGVDLSALIASLKLEGGEVALDVAAGTGFTAMELARRVKRVIAMDVTPEMLREAERLAGEGGFTNIVFKQGDALSIPFPDEVFDVVTTRRAAHHFPNIQKFLRESRRALKDNGRLGVVDMSPIEETQGFVNMIERMRDPTYNRALTPTEWETEVTQAGFDVVHKEIFTEEVTLEKWLYPVKPDSSEAEAVKDAWSKASQDVRELLKIKENPADEISWLKHRIVLVARKLPLAISAQ